MEPSGSLDPAVEADTVSAAMPLAGVPLHTATGAQFTTGRASHAEAAPSPCAPRMSASVELAVDAVTETGATPEPGERARAATGDWFATMVTVAVALAVAPRLSVAVAVTVYVPGTVYWCAAANVATGALPSPKSMELEATLPSESLAVAVALTVCGAIPVLRSRARVTTGGLLEATTA